MEGILDLRNTRLNSRDNVYRHHLVIPVSVSKFELDFSADEHLCDPDWIWKMKRRTALRNRRRGYRQSAASWIKPLGFDMAGLPKGAKLTLLEV